MNLVPGKAGSGALDAPPAGAPGRHKALNALSGLLRDVSACRAELVRREAALADFERRMLADLGPMQDKLAGIRIDTLRILGRHLAAGWLGRRDRARLESALYDLANALESEYAVDLREDRDRIFGHAAAYARADRDGDDGEEENPEAGGSSFYRESDFAGGSRGPGQGHPGSRPAGKPDIREESFAGDIRALYLLLARALHPDKEPDAARREEKTGWMQKVVSAYESRDLARLLDILAQDPLEAVGPYLSQAPLKTVQGYAKRLRRDLEALRTRLSGLGRGPDSVPGSLFRDGKVNEAAYDRHLGEMRKDLRFMKERRDRVRTTQGLRELIEALGTHDWRDLL